MKLSEHLTLLDKGDISPRVIERPSAYCGVSYYGWTPTDEGPPRPDHAAAFADLRDMMANGGRFPRPVLGFFQGGRTGAEFNDTLARTNALKKTEGKGR